MRTVWLLYGCRCRACCDQVERTVRLVAGVMHAEANLYKATLTVEHDDRCTCGDILAAVERIGYLAELNPAGSGVAGPERAAPSNPARGPLLPRVIRPPVPPAGNEEATNG